MAPPRRCHLITRVPRELLLKEKPLELLRFKKEQSRRRFCLCSTTKKNLSRRSSHQAARMNFKFDIFAMKI